MAESSAGLLGPRPKRIEEHTMNKWLIRAAVLMMWLSFSPSPVFAQNAQITGVVKDTSGGVVPGVTVTGRNAENGFTRVAVTEGNGEYRLPSLPPGRYAVTAELSGFNTETRADIVLVIEQTAIIAFTLKPAAVAETVVVTAESPIVDTTRADVSTAAANAQIQDLPVAPRLWIDLAVLTPGASPANL